MLPTLRACSCPCPPKAGVRLLMTPSGVNQCGSCLGLRYTPSTSSARLSFAGGMVGKSYLLKGELVTVVAQWRGTGCPRNVVVRDEQGNMTVRPARGLRRMPT